MNHVLNRSPTLAVKDVTPEEAWSGVKPSVDYFRVFGCVRYGHISDAKRKKLEDKSVSCVSFRISGESKEYIMFDTVANKITVSRDVIFYEDREWDWKNSKNETDLDGGESIEISTATKEDTEQHTGSTSSINSYGEIEPTAAPATEIEPGLAIREGRSRRPPIWSIDYVSGEGLSEKDDVSMTFFTI